MGFLQRVNRALQNLARVIVSEMRWTKRVIVAPESRPVGETPLFITGVHRSGTTLLRLIVDSHSRIACPPESFFMLPLSQLLDDRKGIQGLTAMGFTQSHVLRQVREFVSYFFEMYAASQGKQRWADKTPSYVNCLDFIEALYGPACGYVFVYRHGLDSACSIARACAGMAELDAHLEACGGDPFAAAARYWAAQCRKMLDFQRAHPSRVLELRYEQFAQDPEPHLRRLFEFIDEPWEPEVLRFYEHPHDRARGLQDRTSADTRGFQPNIGSYRKQPAQVVGKMIEQAGPMLEKLGYEYVEDPSAPQSG